MSVIDHNQIKVKSYFKIFTPEEAKTLLTELRGSIQSALQRKTKPARIKAYAAEMRRGTWQPTSVISITFVGDVRFLSDGQNRLAAVILANVPVAFHVLEWTLPDDDALRAQYGVIDIGAVRSKTDIIKSQLFGTAVPDNMKPGNYAKIASAISVLMEGFRVTSARTKTPYAQVELMPALMEYEEAGQLFFTNIAGKPLSRRLTGTSTTSVALETFREKPDRAADFWSKVASDNAAEGSPAWHCAQVLKANLVDTVKVNVLAYLVAKCWNAFYNKEKIDASDLIASEVNTKVPIRIAGTKFKGKDFVYLTISGELVIKAESDDESEGATTETPDLSAAQQLIDAHTAESAEANADAEDESITVELAA